MDLTVVYAIAIVAAVIAMTALVTYLRKHDIVRTEDLEMVEKIFNLTTALVDELNLKQEDKIMQISQIVISSLDYAVKISENPEDVMKYAEEEAFILCKELGIELTESRKTIITQLLQLGLNNKYTKTSNGVYVRIQQ